MATFDTINEARKLLGVNETATLKEINRAYKQLSHQYHPDVSGNKNDDAMKKLNHAYKLLMDYIKEYVYSFRKEDVARTYPFDDHMSRYYDSSDWM